MKRLTKQVHDEKGYLLGKNTDGESIYLVKPSWDCNWYWGFGYLQMWEPRRRDFNCHTHWDSLIKGQIHKFNDLTDIVETTLTDNEHWQLAELMRSFYILKEAAALFGIGGAHVTTNLCKDILKSSEKANHINKELLPAIFAAIDKLLSPQKDA